MSKERNSGTSKKFSPSPEVMAKAEALVLETLLRLGGSPVPVSWDLRGLAAGQCCRTLKDGQATIRIRLNPEAALIAPEQFLLQVPVHEAVHAFLFQKGKLRHGHGWQWQALMLSVGAKPLATHRLNLTPARTCSTVPYVCGCPGRIYRLTPAKHAKATAGRIKPFCRFCQQFIGVQASVAVSESGTASQSVSAPPAATT